MNAIILMLVAFAILVFGYLTYGAWLAKQWGVDETKKTPAHTNYDGVDFVPAKAPVLLGHHFASIAGASPINGPVQAAVFGWAPVFLWVVLCSIFVGAVHDFSSLLASVRHGGRSIGHVIEVNIGARGKKLFLVFAWLTLLLVIAAFADIVAETFAGIGADGEIIASSGSTAMASMLFIVVSIVFGFAVYRRNVNLGLASIIGVVFIAIAIAAGMYCPIYFTKQQWLIVIFIYIFVASAAPVWILLQPRDYLNSFLLYAMMIAAFCGILFTGPKVNLPAFRGVVADGVPIFPILFITVTCGACSGFHSLVCSGTTSKQLNKESDARVIGYGGMLLESGLAVISLIAVGSLYTAADGMPTGAPPAIFAAGVSGFIESLGIPKDIVYTVITLSVSAFSMTSLDTAARLGRYMLEELFVSEGGEPAKHEGVSKLVSNMYFSTAVTVLFSGALAIGGYKNIWPLFGSANQLLAALALIACCVWLGNIGKNNKMFFIPMVFMLLATLSALAIHIKGCVTKLVTAGGGGLWYKEGLQIVFGALLFCLGLVLAAEAFQALSKKKKGAGAQ